VGLPDSSRRRTPGLRREDVAALAGVSVTWYTWLEQGRDIRVSSDVLEKIATTLQMSPDEREYLFALVQHRPAPIMPEVESAYPEVQRMIDVLNVPAVVITMRWDVIAWNPLATRVFRDYGALPPRDRNLLRIILTTDSFRTDPDEFEAIARRVLSKFRVEYNQAPDDPQMQELVEDLRAACPNFDEIWTSAEVRNRSVGVHVARHPELGAFTFEHSSYVPEGSPNLRLIVFVPNDDECREKMARIVADGSRSHPAD